MKARIALVVVVTFLLAATPPAATQAPMPKRVGLIFSSPVASAPFAMAIRDELNELGWVEGRNVAYEVRFTKASRSV